MRENGPEMTGNDNGGRGEDQNRPVKKDPPPFSPARRPFGKTRRKDEGSREMNRGGVEGSQELDHETLLDDTTGDEYVREGRRRGSASVK
jgi:hypothetical protein